MIDTVPSNVKLTDVIDPIPNKVDGVQLSIGFDTLLLRASLRVESFLQLCSLPDVSHSSLIVPKPQR
jgi:hypothetical protein